jgi:hypothetical protein
MVRGLHPRILATEIKLAELGLGIDPFEGEELLASLLLSVHIALSERAFWTSKLRFIAPRRS